MISMTKKDLAVVAGYSYRRLFDIDQELSKGAKLFVKSEDGKYDLALFVQRWVAYNVSGARGDDETLEEVKAIHEKVKTQKTEMEVAKMKGALIDIQDIRRCWDDVANTVMQSFLNLPGKLAPALVMRSDAEVISGMIDLEVRNILEQISDTPLPSYIRQEETETEDEDDQTD